VDKGSSGGGSICSNGGSSISSSVDNRGGLDRAGDSSMGNMVGVGHHSGGNRLLDDGLTLDWDGVGGIVRSINMDGGGDLDNVGGGEGGVIGDGNLTLNKDGGLDIVYLNLAVDDGSIDGLGSLEDSGDLDGEMRGGRLQDSGVVSGDIAGLSIVDLLGDDGLRLVDSGDSGSLSNSGVGGGGSGLGIGLGDGLNRSVGDEAVSCGGRASAVGHSTSSVGTSYTSVGSGHTSNAGNGEGDGGGPAHCGQDKGKCHKWSHFACIFH